MQPELIVPGGAEYLAADAAFAAILPEQGGHHAPQHPQVLRRRPVFQPTVVLPENDIQHPVQTIFDVPMSPGASAQFCPLARRLQM